MDGEVFPKTTDPPVVMGDGKLEFRKPMKVSTTLQKLKC